jgi:tripartite-type tricarboxylate transporter receptor subunit TctC
MKLPSYQLLQMAADVGAVWAAPRVAREQAYPTRSVAALGLEPVADTPEEFAVRIRTDITKWTKIIRAAGIKAD